MTEGNVRLFSKAIVGKSKIGDPIIYWKSDEKNSKKLSFPISGKAISIFLLKIRNYRRQFDNSLFDRKYHTGKLKIGRFLMRAMLEKTGRHNHL